MNFSQLAYTTGHIVAWAGGDEYSRLAYHVCSSRTYIQFPRVGAYHMNLEGLPILK